MAQGLPFSPAVRVGHMVYLSGQLGTVPGTRQLVDTGIAAQTRQALDNVTAAPPSPRIAPARLGERTGFHPHLPHEAPINAAEAALFPHCLHPPPPLHGAVL